MAGKKPPKKKVEDQNKKRKEISPLSDDSKPVKTQSGGTQVKSSTGTLDSSKGKSGPLTREATYTCKETDTQCVTPYATLPYSTPMRGPNMASPFPQPYFGYHSPQQMQQQMQQQNNTTPDWALTLINDMQYLIKQSSSKVERTVDDIRQKVTSMEKRMNT